MTIDINEKGTKEFYEEAVSLKHQYRYLVRNPRAKYISSFKELSIVIFAMGFMFGCCLHRGNIDGFSPLTSCVMTMAASVFLELAITYCGMKKRVKIFLEDGRTSTITLDNNGVELNKEGAQVIRLFWDNVAFVRSFKESTSFFTKDAIENIISVPNKYKNQIMEYLNTNDMAGKIINTENKRK